MTLPKDTDDCLLAPLRNDGELDLALLNVKNCVGKVTLPKNNLILLTFRYCFAVVHHGKKRFGIKGNSAFLPRSSLFLFTGAPARN